MLRQSQYLINSRVNARLTAILSALLLICLAPVGYAKATEFPSCTIEGTSSAEILTGTAGNDVICTGGGDDQINALGGDDFVIIELHGSVQITLGPGNDVLHAQSADSVTVDGGAGGDEIFGSSGIDLLVGGSGDDSIEGGDGADDISGGSGEDSIEGGDGNDLLAGGGSIDTLNGGLGLNVCDFDQGETKTDTCIYDDDAPKFLVLRASKKTVEVGASNGVIQVTAKIREATLLDEIWVKCYKPSGGPTFYTDVIYTPGETPGYRVSTLVHPSWEPIETSGTNGDIDVVFPIEFRRGAAPGAYDCSATLKDSLGQNSTVWFELKVTRNSGTYDDDAPKFLVLRASKKTVEVGASNGVIQVTAKIREATLLDEIWVKCYKPSGGPTFYTDVIYTPGETPGYRVSTLVHPSWEPIETSGTNGDIDVVFPIEFRRGAAPGAYDCSATLKDSLGQNSTVWFELKVTRTVQ
jgi:hypothetical protein